MERSWVGNQLLDSMTKIIFFCDLCYYSSIPSSLSYGPLLMFYSLSCNYTGAGTPFEYCEDVPVLLF